MLHIVSGDDERQIDFKTICSVYSEKITPWKGNQNKLNTKQTSRNTQISLWNQIHKNGRKNKNVSQDTTLKKTVH